MNVLELAKHIEAQGKAYYLSLAENSPKELKAVFTFLAEEEQYHYELFSSIEQQSPSSEPENRNLIQKAKEVFSKLAPDFSIPQTFCSVENHYSKALTMEQESIEFYNDLLENTKSEKERALIKIIITQEKKHSELVESIIELVRNTRQWIENAEWNHLNDTY